MKTIKQIISDADPRLKGVLVIMIAYVMVMATTDYSRRYSRN